MNCEFHAMGSKGVRKIVLFSSMPYGRKLVGNIWVYTENDGGTYISRIVAQGFCQVPGKDLTDSLAPVVTDLAFRWILIIKVFDIEVQNSTKKST
jgi:Reverse transcriptase (RNA-dependent DNA polymerase)